MRSTPTLQCCVNGQRSTTEHPAVPMTAVQMVREAAAAIAAGADDIHLHPKSPAGDDTMAPDVVDHIATTFRAELPGVTFGVTTGAWTVLPDHASVNWHEDGADALASTLLQRGIRVDAGVWAGTDGLERFLRSPIRRQVRQVLVEVSDERPPAATTAAEELLRGLDTSATPLLVHGEGASTWPIVALARRAGHATRIGLEDTLRLPDGRIATDNAALVRACVALDRT